MARPEFRTDCARRPGESRGQRSDNGIVGWETRVADAVAEMQRGRELDQLSFQMNRSVARMLCLARKYDEAPAEFGGPGTYMQIPRGSISGCASLIG
jgi:hypothetical protein